MMDGIRRWLFGEREPAFGMMRAPKWSKIREEFLKRHPDCEVCQKKDGVVPHHIIPVHVDATRELDMGNLIPLCPDHHLLFGHLMNWASWNPNVVQDCRAWNERIRNRQY